MTPERLTRQARRALERKSRNIGRPLTRDEILQLRVQTVDPWKRFGVIVIGSLIGVAALMIYEKVRDPLISVGFGFVSLLFLLWGVFGKEGELAREINEMPGDWPQRILDALFNGL